MAAYTCIDLRQITPRLHINRRTGAFMCIVGTLICTSLLYKGSWSPVSSADERWTDTTPIHITERRFVEQVGERWTDTTPINITERRFTASEDKRVFILGVVAKNSTPVTHWDEIAVYGQWYDAATLNDDSLLCCFKGNDGQIVQQKPAAFNVRDYRQWSKLMTSAPLALWHITCRKPPSLEPRWVTIARHSNCSSDHVTYIEPYYAMKRPDGHHVITTKFAYGRINPHMVVSFLETMKYFGMDKVVTYVHPTLDPVVKRVLSYYSYQGLLDYYKIELADAERAQHKFADGQFDAQYHSDEWLVKKDALERNIGSTYFGIFDMDEFVIPSHDRSYKQLMNDLRRTFPDASHFFFTNVHYLTDDRTPDAVCAPHCTIFNRFLHTSPIRFNDIYEKMFLLTDRVLSQTLDNLYVMSRAGYKRVTCPQTEAYTSHYGGCHRKFSKSVCAQRQSWLKDMSMVAWAEKTVDGRIQAATRLLGLSAPADLLKGSSRPSE